MASGYKRQTVARVGPGRRKRKVFWCSANRTNRFIAAAGKTVRLFGQGNRGGRISKLVGWEVRRVRGRLEGKDQDRKRRRTVEEGFRPVPRVYSWQRHLPRGEYSSTDQMTLVPVILWKF